MKILCITSRLPWPLEKGDKLRIFHQLRELSRHHEVVLFSINDQAVHPKALEELKAYCTSVEVHTHSRLQLLFNLLRGWLTGLPLQVAYFTSKEAKNQLRHFIEREKPDAVYCQLIRTAEYRELFPGDWAVLDYMDVFSKGVERRLMQVSWYKRPFFRMEWKRLLRYEARVFPWFKRHTVISEQDLRALPLKEADRDQVVVVPNGVDEDFFKPRAADKDFELLFNGNMNYPPNIDSAVFLVREVMPLVWKQSPVVRLLISGANPSQEVRALAGERVIVSGWVEDIRDNFARSRVLVAPMRSSIGLQNKLLEAMAMGLPCITTPLSNNALGADPDVEILIASTAAEFAGQIGRVLGDKELAATLTENGHALIKRRFGWSGCTAALLKLFS